MKDKDLMRMKLVWILISVAVVAAYEDDKEEVKYPEKHDPVIVIDIPDKLLPKNIPNKCSITIYNCQRETRYTVTYKGEEEGDKESSKKE